MKKKYLYMFLILQFLLIIVNFFNINNTLFNIEINTIIKFFIFCYVILFVMFLSNISKKYKLIYLLTNMLVLSSMFFEKNNIINYLYFINTYSFILSYYYGNTIKKYKFINILTILLIIAEFYLLITNNSSFTFQLIINILLPITLSYFESQKKISIFIVLLTILLATLNNMNLIFYNMFFISIIICCFSLRKKDNMIFPLIMIVLTIIISIVKNVFKIDSFLDSFSKFSLSINFYSILIILPIILIVLILLYKILKHKNISLGLILNLYTLILITIFGSFSLRNIDNELIIILYSYLLIIEINSVKQINKKLDDSVTILALHLGYGGIEQYISSLTKMIDKKINIVSTYKLYDKTPFDYNAKISYLMEYGPNTKEIKDALNNKKIINIFIEGIKSIKILYLKKYKNIETIENICSKYVITTREFHNELVGFYGRSDIIKIATEHNYHNNNKKYINRLINSVNNLDYFVLVSKYLEDYYKDKVKVKTMYIPNVIETIPKEKSKGVGHNLVSVGRLSKVKAQDDLIELIYLLKKDYSNIKLTLIGDGEEKENLEKLILKKDLKDNIILTGFLKKNEIAKEYINSNIFVTTSKSESFGLVAIEASSFHLPVVAFDRALGLKEVLENDCGVLIKNGNIKEMKEKIEKLFEDKKYRDKISENGYLNCQKYLLSNVKKMWKEIIK